MKRTLPLLIKNVLLLVLCGLPGTLSHSEVNDLQSTIRQNKATLYSHTTPSVDFDLRRNTGSATPKSAPSRPSWNPDLPKIHPRGDPTQKIVPMEQSEEDEEDETEKVGRTTTVNMPTYFSYGTTRRANFRDRVNRVVANSTNKIVNSRRNNQVSVSDGDDAYTTTATITSNEPTMTYSSDILKVTPSNRSTSWRTPTSRFTRPTDETRYPRPSTPRDGRIMTGRRKVNNSDESSTPTDHDRLYLERIQQQLQATTYSPTSTTGLSGQVYHDIDKNVEFKKKPIKKETEGGEFVSGDKTSPSVVGGKTEKQYFKESLSKSESGKMKEYPMNETQRTDRPSLDGRYSTIIDSLSKGSSNVPSNIESNKNVTINNEPGTNLLETDNGGSKETNEKRDTEGNDDEASKSGISDVIPVIIKNSVVAEGVSDLVNKTNGLKYHGDDKSNNESLLLSSTLVTSINNPREFSESSKDGTKVSQPQESEFVESGDKNEEPTTKSKIPSGLSASGVEKDDVEVKKKTYILKKPLLPTSSGKMEDSFEVMLKNGSTSEDDVITPYFSSSLPSLTLELNKTETNEEKLNKENRVNETRTSSSAVKITSSFSSSSRINSGSGAPEEFTTFASNNLENNIITTSTPMFYGFTSTTPRVNHYFSLRTTTTVQSQPATSTGENLIKQITSFNSRRRPATFYQLPSSMSTTEKVEDHSGGSENLSKTQSTDEAIYSNSEPAHRSSSSIRPSTIRKIVPWSTRLQKVPDMPETTSEGITTDDYSYDTSTPSNHPLFGSSSMSSFSPPDGQEFSTTSSSNSEGPSTHKASSTTYSMPTATFTSYITSETPSSSTSTPASVDSSMSSGSRFVDEASSVPPSSQSYSSLSSTTSESPTIIDLDFTDGNSTIGNVSTSKPLSKTPDGWITTETGDLMSDPMKGSLSTSKPFLKTSDSWISTETEDLTSDPPKSTSESFPKISDGLINMETGNLTNDPHESTIVGSSLDSTTKNSSSVEVETKKSDDWFDSTTWSTFKDHGDDNSTEDLEFGDGDGTWIVKSTTSVSTQTGVGSSNSTGRQPTISTVSSFGENKDITSTKGNNSTSTLRPYITSKSRQNLTSTSGWNATTTLRPPRQKITSNSILKLNSTSGPYKNSDSNQNLTSIYHSNLTSTPTTTSSGHETEDFFDTDDEEIHTTTTFSTDGEFDHGNEEEDDKINVSPAQTTLKPSRDNRIIPYGSSEGTATTISGERNNFIMKISTTTEDNPLWTHLWTTDVDDGGSTTVSNTAKVDETTVTTAPSPPPAGKVKPSVTHRPIRPVTIEPEMATVPPQNMGLSLIVKGATLNEICDAQQSLKKAIIFLFRNTTGRILYEDQIVFPSLTRDECTGARSGKNGIHNVDLVIYDENGNFDDELNSEFRSLWKNNGLRTNIAIHDVYLLFRQEEDVHTSSMTIAVIVISCIGLTCLLLFFILMMILRKRQKKFNYGQRCTPVSLDDYSLDNISVFNSMRRKNARRASKRSYGNPAFDDPAAPSHQINFAALAHLSTNRKAMDDEFSEIPMFSPKMDELLPGAETKNRYANVIPLPETRVQLSVRDGDDPVTGYINANYVKGPKGEAKFYIACQAPMQSTVNDFWRMIWEQQSKLILMLTDLHENGVEKCFDYLPPSEVLDCHRLFGDYQVTLKKREVREKYVISHLQLKNLDSNLWREVTHLWYTSWPHQGVPTEGTSIIAYLIEARSYMRNTSGPHIVHCSPGVGRTGTVLAIDLCIREFETSRMVDVPRTVYGLRRNRAGCVQTKDQYAFIYMVLNVYGTKLTGGALDSM